MFLFFSAALQLQKNDDLAKHQAVNKNDGVYHSSGEQVKKEEFLDTEDYSQEEVEAEDIFQKQDNLGVDVSYYQESHKFWLRFAGDWAKIHFPSLKSISDFSIVSNLEFDVSHNQ